MDRPSTTNAQTEGTKKWLSLVSLALGAVLMVIIGLLVWLDVKRNAIVVEPFGVPEQYGKDGYSNEVITKKLIEAVRQAEGSVKIRRQKGNEVLVLSTEKDILTDFEVPATKLSVRTAISAVRKLLGVEQRQLSGDIVFTAHCNDGNGPALPVQTPVEITIRLSPDTGNAPPNTVCVNNGKSEEAMIAPASEAILERLNPLVFAAYLGLTKHEYARSIELTDKLINETNQNDHDSLSNCYNLRGVIYFNAQKADDLAISDFREAIKLKPSAAGPYNNIGLIFVRQGNYRDAIAEFEHAIAIDDSFPQAYSNLGLALYRLNEQENLEEAKADFQKAVRLDNTFSQAHFNLGLVLMDEADSSTDAATGRGLLKDAVANFALAEQFGLRDGSLYYQWGDALRSLKSNDDAITQFRKADTQGFQNASLYRDWGDTLFDNRQYPEAAAKYRKAIAAEPNDYISFNSLGMALYKSGKLDEAKRNYEQASKLSPAFPQSHYDLGIVLADEGKLENAKDEFRRALALDSSFANAYVRLGRVFSDEGTCEAALVAFQNALKLDPNNSYAYNYSGVVLRKQGKLDEAVVNFRKAVELQPDSDEFHYNLSIALQSQGKPNDAETERIKAAHLDAKTAQKCLKQSKMHCGPSKP